MNRLVSAGVASSAAAAENNGNAPLQRWENVTTFAASDHAAAWGVIMWQL